MYYTEMGDYCMQKFGFHSAWDMLSVASLEAPPWCRAPPARVSSHARAEPLIGYRSDHQEDADRPCRNQHDLPEGVST